MTFWWLRTCRGDIEPWSLRLSSLLGSAGIDTAESDEEANPAWWAKAGLVSADLGMDREATDQGRFLCCFPIFRFLYLIWVTFRTCICDHCQEVCHFHSALANRTVFYGRLYRNLWNLIDWTKSPDHRMLYIHWRVSIWLEKCKYFLTDNWSRVVG